jgi:hypothetical protein
MGLGCSDPDFAFVRKIVRSRPELVSVVKWVGESVPPDRILRNFEEYIATPRTKTCLWGPFLDFRAS